MSGRWVVMKFGGTSVADAGQWQIIDRLLETRRSNGHRVLLVCSALAGVTDQLLELASLPATDESSAPHSASDALLERLLDQHQHLAISLQIDPEPLLEQGKARIHNALSEPDGPTRTAAILACGEWLSSQLGAAFLNREDRPVHWVDARDALSVIEESDRDAPRAWLSAQVEAGEDARLQKEWASQGDALIAQGYVARAPDGRTALLGRSGSDTSAALLGSRLGAERVEIWTDVPGLFTADPRQEPEAKLIQSLGWEEALEMAAGGARVIHGRSIRAAAAAAIPLWIGDLSDPEGEGTLIGSHSPGEPSGPEARAVVSQDEMLVLLLRNLDTRQQVGFLAGVFDVVRRMGFSVDQVATSETTTTLAIDRAGNHIDDAALKALVNALEPLCEVRAFPDCSCVSIVGRNARRCLTAFAATGQFFDSHPLYMMSHSAADRSVSLLVDTGSARTLAHQLHEVLVPGADHA